MSLAFVYRSHYAGLLSKRVVRLPDPDLLSWFQRIWKEVKNGEDPDDIVENELKDEVYGFSSLFRAIKEHKLAAPRSLKKLRELLQEHVYVEGEILLDDHGLRAFTDDDEVQLAYFFFDDQADPSRVAYLLHEEFPLPSQAARTSSFSSPVAATPLPPAGASPGRTWAVILTFYDSDSIPSVPPSVFEGIRLPALLDHLRSVQPPAPSQPGAWPLELRLLRAAIQPADSSLEPALQRLAAYPLADVGGSLPGDELGLGPQTKAWTSFATAAAKKKKPKRLLNGSRIEVSEHIAQAALHQTEFFGHQQLFLFDDLWASAHPDLAASLLRYAAHWDPWGEAPVEE
ncbi:MAG: hypothetical protein MUF64_24960 [Polyangiaceae bacterium]|nr:hypothetical protein [Polyangiaceae bacterium]